MDGYFVNERTSYEWNVHLNGRSPESPGHWGGGKAMWDYQPWHDEEDEDGARNTLFLDMHVEGL